MRITVVSMLALLPVAPFESAKAAVRRPFTVQTPSGEILVESSACNAGEPRPAVLILSGSRGFGASVYDEIGQALCAARLNAYLVHVFSSADLEAIASKGTARARIGYYAKRLPDWIAAVRGVVADFNDQSRHTGRVGVLGISLGAQTAITASIDGLDIGALVLVDGGLPNGHSKPIRSLPPLHLIWGSADGIFPLSVGQELRQMARDVGGSASLDVYKGGTHDFFLKSGTPQARAAHQSAASFLAAKLAP